MSNYLHTKICEIQDAQFQSMVNELSICIDYPLTQFINQSLSYMLMVIVQQKRQLTQSQMPFDGVLTTKVIKLLPESVVYSVCNELALAANKNIECFDKKNGPHPYQGNPQAYMS